MPEKGRKSRKRSSKANRQSASTSSGQDEGSREPQDTSKGVTSGMETTSSPTTVPVAETISPGARATGAIPEKGKGTSSKMVSPSNLASLSAGDTQRSSPRNGSKMVSPSDMTSSSASDTQRNSPGTGPVSKVAIPKTGKGTSSKMDSPSGIASSSASGTHRSSPRTSSKMDSPSGIASSAPMTYARRRAQRQAQRTGHVRAITETGRLVTVAGLMLPPETPPSSRRDRRRRTRTAPEIHDTHLLPMDIFFGRQFLEAQDAHFQEMFNYIDRLMAEDSPDESRLAENMLNVIHDLLNANLPNIDNEALRAKLSAYKDKGEKRPVADVPSPADELSQNSTGSIKMCTRLGTRRYVIEDIPLSQDGSPAVFSPESSSAGKLDQALPSSSQSLPRGSPQSLPQCSPQGLPQGSPQSLPQCSPQGLPQGSPQNLPHCSPHGLPPGSPQNLPHCSPQGLPQGSPHNLPQCSPQGLPQGSPHNLPQCSPQGLPQGSPQNLPHCSPQGLPQSSLESSPRYYSARYVRRSHRAIRYNDLLHQENVAPAPPEYSVDEDGDVKMTSPPSSVDEDGDVLMRSPPQSSSPDSDVPVSSPQNEALNPEEAEFLRGLPDPIFDEDDETDSGMAGHIFEVLHYGLGYQKTKLVPKHFYRDLNFARYDKCTSEASSAGREAAEVASEVLREQREQEKSASDETESSSRTEEESERKKDFDEPEFTG